MKTLKFTPELVEKIISGAKRATWRLFDDKELTIGDEIQFVNKDTGHIFGTACITSLYTKTLGTLTEVDWVGHELYVSTEAMYHDFQQYYGDTVTPDTEVKIITFSFEAKVYNQITVVDENDVVIGFEFMRDAIKKGMIRRAS